MTRTFVIERLFLGLNANACQEDVAETDILALCGLTFISRRRSVPHPKFFSSLFYLNFFFNLIVFYPF